MSDEMPDPPIPQRMILLQSKGSTVCLMLLSRSLTKPRSCSIDVIAIGDRPLRARL